MNKLKLTGNQTQASEFFLNGHRCSEAILKSYGPSVGLPESLAMKIGCALGGGLGSTRNLCGAVSSAIIVLGLIFGRESESDQLSKDKTNQIISQFVEKFLSTFQSLNCNDLLNLDEDICPRLVQEATKILDEIIAKEKKF
ncbi:MAG: hypothetical protein A2202_03150 [Bdellovibrionales bacterium RIFOXYA1_FULL_36_14]|nr:MAG: hypothetical protein A2202_03150 [Bdellovibrionales bacterium RIFOXYA1_FULL_36_14]